MRLSAAIMAHPTRQASAEQLQASLDRDVPIVYDANPVPSADPEQRWATAARAWQTHDPDADWHLVLQDDAIACTDLLAGLEKALDQLGTQGLVSTYIGSGRPHPRSVIQGVTEARTRGHSWVASLSLNWGVATVAPVHTIPGMLEWAGGSRMTGGKVDTRVGTYYRDHLLWRTWYTLPSLVDHRDDPSLVGHSGRRRALLHHTGSALDVDWTRHDGLHPHLSQPCPVMIGEHG